MAEDQHRRFTLEVRELSGGEVHDVVAKVQHYLSRYGYLGDPYEYKRLDDATQASLRLFQRRVGLPETGVIDPDTASALEEPRCGVPDVRPGQRAFSSLPPGFALTGCDYEAEFRTLTYAFVNGTADLPGTQEKQAVRNAFATWQREVSLDFQEVGLQNNPNFTIGWFVGDHRDGSPFDGVGNTLGHATAPPPCGGARAGECHFDDAETWALAAGDNNNQVDVESIALHEIGHLLGLDHSDVPGSVMFPFPNINVELRALAQDDIDGIRALYGRRGQTLEVLVHLEDIGDQTYRENELAGTRGQSRRLEGFQITIDPPVGGLSMRYMAHLQAIGDVPFVTEGQFVGSRTQSRRLEGFAIELTGAAAPNFSVFYMAHLQDSGDTGFFQNGQFCGTRGQSRRVEGILVRVEPGAPSPTVGSA